MIFVGVSREAFSVLLVRDQCCLLKECVQGFGALSELFGRINAAHRLAHKCLQFVFSPEDFLEEPFSAEALDEAAEKACATDFRRRHKKGFGSLVCALQKVNGQGASYLLQALPERLLSRLLLLTRKRFHRLFEIKAYASCDIEREYLIQLDDWLGDTACVVLAEDRSVKVYCLEPPLSPRSLGVYEGEQALHAAWPSILEGFVQKPLYGVCLARESSLFPADGCQQHVFYHCEPEYLGVYLAYCVHCKAKRWEDGCLQNF